MGVVIPNLVARTQVISEIGGVHVSGFTFERSMAYNDLLSTTVQAVIRYFPLFLFRSSARLQTKRLVRFLRLIAQTTRSRVR